MSELERLNRIEGKIDTVLDYTYALVDALKSTDSDLATDEDAPEEETDAQKMMREHMKGIQECYESEMEYRNLAMKALLGGHTEKGLEFYSQFLLQSQAYWFHIFEIVKLLAENKKKKLVLPTSF